MSQNQDLGSLTLQQALAHFDFIRHNIHKETAAAAAIIGITTSFVALRFISKLVNRKAGYGLDDLFVVVAWLTILAMDILGILSDNNFITQFYPLVSKSDGIKAATDYLRTQYAVEVVYPLACLFPRLATGFLYLRIFPTKPERIATYAVMAFLVVDAIAWWIPSVLQCTPPSEFWNLMQDPATKTCIGAGRKYWISFPHIFEDLALLIIPLRAIWRLNASVAKRVGLLITFLTAIIGLAASTVRFGIYVHSSNIPPQDQSIQLVVAADVATFVEPAAYLVAICMPPLRSLFQAALNKTRQSFPSFASSGFIRGFTSGGASPDVSPDVSDKRSPLQSQSNQSPNRLRGLFNRSIGSPQPIPSDSVDSLDDKLGAPRTYEARAEAVDMV